METANDVVMVLLSRPDGVAANAGVASREIAKSGIVQSNFTQILLNMLFGLSFHHAVAGNRVKPFAGAAVPALDAPWSNRGAGPSKTARVNSALLRQSLRSRAMTSLGGVSAVIAIVLMLAPVSIQMGTAGGTGGGIELIDNKPAYPPCAYARRGQTCYTGHGLSSGGGGRRHRHESSANGDGHRGKRRGDLSPRGVRSFAQQLACQPCGNGISGQAS